MPPLIFIILVGTLAFVCSYLLTSFIRIYAIKKSLIDIPGDRTSHDTPTPRGGGMAFITTWVLVLLLGTFSGYIDQKLAAAIIPASLLIAFVAFMDDHYDLSSMLRLLVQIIAAVVFLYFLDALDSPGSASVVAERNYTKMFLEMVAIVWSINLFNFMDGIDTIASVEGIYLFLLGGIFIFISGGTVEGSLAVILSFSIAGFLLWNLPPAKIFMGDAGSHFLGFMVAALALICERKYGLSLLVWVILYGAFWFDAVLTLIRRMIRKEKWYMPHKLHAYQRLHQSGMSHGKVTLIYLKINVILAAIAYVGFTYVKLLNVSLIVSIVILSVLYFKAENLAPFSK